MNEAEKEVRENIALINQILPKLNMIRNELIPYYGKDITLEEVEELLWNQYLKFNDKIHKIFK